MSAERIKKTKAITDSERIEWLSRQKDISAMHIGFGEYAWYWNPIYKKGVPDKTLREAIDDEIRRGS